MLRTFPVRNVLYTSLAALSLALAAIAMPATAGSPVVPRALGTGAFTAGVSGGPVLDAINTDGSNPFNDYGVEGKVQNDIGGVGILGYGQQAKTYGVYGVSFGTNGIGVYGAGDGPTPAPGASPDSSTQSTGVVGDSHSGFGVFGSTEFPNASAGTPGNIAAGVFGADLSNAAHQNFGVVGTTTNGGYGVAGFGASGAVGGVQGFATTGSGVHGYSNSGVGGSFGSVSGDGIDATGGSNSGAAGISATGSSSGYAGRFADDSSLGIYVTSAQGTGTQTSTETGTGLYATSTSGDAIQATTDTGTALYAMGSSGTGIYTTTSSGTALKVGATGGTAVQVVNSNGNGIVSTGSNIGAVVRAPASTSTFPIVATDSSGNNVFYVDGLGNVRYHGTIGTAARTRDGLTATSFGARSSEPTIEDTGSAQLVSGRAAVRLDPAFVEQMDLSSSYRVFVTPDADTRGLFVEAKTPAGFVVRETQGGRGTFAFDYRIVASIDGQAHSRMALTRDANGGFSAPHVPITSSKPNVVRKPIAAPNHSQPKTLSIVRNANSSALAQKHAMFVPSPNLGVEHRSL